MAMNKVEKAALKAALTLAALRWTSPVKPDRKAPLPCATLCAIQGWDYSVRLGGYGSVAAAFQAWSTSVVHGTGSWEQYKRLRSGGTQGPRNLYSTKLLALRAARHDLERQCAAALQAVDAMIEEETAAEAAATLKVPT